MSEQLWGHTNNPPVSRKDVVRREALQGLHKGICRRIEASRQDTGVCKVDEHVLANCGVPNERMASQLIENYAFLNFEIKNTNKNKLKQFRIEISITLSYFSTLFKQRQGNRAGVNFNTRNAQ